MLFFAKGSYKESSDILFPLAECVMPKVTHRYSFSGFDHCASENPFVINYCLKVTKSHNVQTCSEQTHFAVYL